MESTEDFSLEKNIFIWNENYKRLEALLYLYLSISLLAFTRSCESIALSLHFDRVVFLSLARFKSAVAL